MEEAPDPAAVAAAKQADVIVAVVGITSRLEGEEMRVDQPGFLGGDRTSLDLPKQEEDLVHALARQSQAARRRAHERQRPGCQLGAGPRQCDSRESGTPARKAARQSPQTLSGRSNPAGRLPVTFYKDVQQLPSFEDYSMQGRTYRYFQGEPLWPFGFGLSYTSFRYADLAVRNAAINAGDPLDIAVTVTNTGSLAGDEVVQLYLKFPDITGAPLRALRGFQRIHLAPGASQKVEFHLERRDLSMVTQAGDIIVGQGQYMLSVGGGQPGTGAPSLSSDFEIKGQITLPE